MCTYKMKVFYHVICSFLLGVAMLGHLIPNVAACVLNSIQCVNSTAYSLCVGVENEESSFDNPVNCPEGSYCDWKKTKTKAAKQVDPQSFNENDICTLAIADRILHYHSENSNEEGDEIVDERDCIVGKYYPAKCSRKYYKCVWRQCRSRMLLRHCRYGEYFDENAESCTSGSFEDSGEIVDMFPAWP